MIPATKWNEVTWPSTILQYHSEAAERFGEFLQNWFPYPRLRIPLSADHRDSATKTRAAARQNPWRVDLRLDPNTTSKASKSLPKTTSPKNRTNHKAWRRALHAERVAIKDKFRPKIWTIVQIFGLLLLQRIPAIWSAIFVKKSPTSLRTSCGYLRRGKLLSMQRFFDSLRIEKHSGVYPLKRKLLWMRQIWSLRIEMSGRFIVDYLFISKVFHNEYTKICFYILYFLNYSTI